MRETIDPFVGDFFLSDDDTDGRKKAPPSKKAKTSHQEAQLKKIPTEPNSKPISPMLTLAKAPSIQEAPLVSTVQEYTMYLKQVSHHINNTKQIPPWSWTNSSPADSLLTYYSNVMRKFRKKKDAMISKSEKDAIIATFVRSIPKETAQRTFIILRYKIYTV